MVNIDSQFLNSHENGEGATREQILGLLNEKELPQLWQINYSKDKGAIINGIKMYLDDTNNNGMSKKEKIEYIRYLIVHCLPEQADISFKDVGITQEEIFAIDRESAESFVKEMIERLRLDSVKSEKDFVGVNKGALRWATGEKRIEAVREMMAEFNLSLEDMGTTEEELTKFSKWRAPGID